MNSIACSSWKHLSEWVSDNGDRECISSCRPGQSQSPKGFCYLNQGPLGTLISGLHLGTEWNIVKPWGTNL